MNSQSRALPATILFLSLALAGCTAPRPAPPAVQATSSGWALAIHGGAGVMDRETMSADTQAAYRAALQAALTKGASVLDKGGSALDAAEQVVSALEDDPLFNAGRGAVFTAAGRNELDAAIMDGATLKAGAVAGITGTRNPISLARAVMEKSPHVMLIGAGAERFGQQVGVEQADATWFFTERRWQSLKRTLAERGLPMPDRPPGVGPEPVPVAAADQMPEDRKFGTVGVVVRDRKGHLAAATSTGGTTAKLWGRVGDVPIIGAGTYANDESCAVSATGTGEYFIRLGVAREVCNLVTYKDLSLQQAADEVIQKRLTALGGDGGVIAVAPDGALAWSFNTSGMYRARQSEGQAAIIGIFKNEP